MRMADRRLMDRLVRTLAERRRLWPPDGSSSLACLGLLGWMHLTYSDPEQAARQATSWMWLGGLLDVGSALSASHADTTHFDARDQQAIEAYAAAVAAQVLRIERPKRMAQWEEAREARWQPEDIEMLIALGTAHGAVMRDVIAGVMEGFEHGRSYVVPMFGDLEVDEASSTPADSDIAGDEPGPGLVSLLQYAERRGSTAAEIAGGDAPRYGLSHLQPGEVE
jgi:hypothetical protein